MNDVRALKVNMQTIHYALYKGKKPVTDEYGNRTGESKAEYTKPQKLKINVSATRGTADVEQFGTYTEYSKTLSTCDMACPLNENSILWIGVSPNNPHNYCVSAVAKSLNRITYAIKEVNIS